MTMANHLRRSRSPRGKENDSRILGFRTPVLHLSIRRDFLHCVPEINDTLSPALKIINLNDGLEIGTIRSNTQNFVDADTVPDEDLRASLLTSEFNVLVHKERCSWRDDDSDSQSGYSNFPPDINQSSSFKREIHIQGLEKATKALTHHSGILGKIIKTTSPAWTPNRGKSTAILRDCILK